MADTSLLAATDFWRYQPHPEIWLFMAAVVGLGLYATRVIQPKAVAAGDQPITRSQRRWFVAAVLLLWVAIDWPVHDIAEDHLYSVHMGQHILLTFVVPPMFLLATPTWLARLLLGDGALNRWVQRLARPVPAGVIFNVLAALSHWAGWVNLSTSNGALHYLMHAVIVSSAFLMWMPVCGPLPERRISLPAQIPYLFLMSVIPTIPAAWLTVAEGVLYDSYDNPDRLWGLSVTHDQQVAGLLMKLGGGVYLWTLIFIIFVRWTRQEQGSRKAARFRGTLVPTAHVPPAQDPAAERIVAGTAGGHVDAVSDGGSAEPVLTYDSVQREFERLGPPPNEH